MINVKFLTIGIELNTIINLKSFLISIPQYSFEIDSASSYSDFFSFYKGGNHDILLLNITENTEEILNFIKQNPYISSKAIILSSKKEISSEIIKFGIFDFLTIPYYEIEFYKSINRSINLLISENQILARSNLKKTGYQKFIPISSTKKIELVKVEDIVNFEADGRYTLIHMNSGTSKLAVKNLGEFEKILDPEYFCRIHHKYIINLSKLLNIVKSDGLYCEMENSKIIPVSKRKLECLNAALNIN